MKRKREQKGAVTVFFVIILMACFLFGGFFIDASRILVAKRQVKNAVNSAARSTLSYYDETLVSEYGLFAFDGENAKANFDKYLADNLTKSKDEGMQLYKYSIEKTDVRAQKPITGEELERQIVEYEKYRGPVNMTLGAVEKFKQIFDQSGIDGGKISTATDSIQNFKNEFKDNGGILAAASKAIKNTTKDNIKNGVKKDLSQVTAEWVSNTLPAELKAQYDNANKQIEEAEKRLSELKQERNKYVDAAKQLCDGSEQQSTSEQAGEYIDQDKTLQAQADEQIADLENAIAKAKTIMAEVEKEIEAIRNPLVGIVDAWIAKKAELEPAQTAYDMAKRDREVAEAERNTAQNAVNGYNGTINSASSTILQNNTVISQLKKENEQKERELSGNGYNIYANYDWTEFCRLVDKSNKTAEDSNRINELLNKYKGNPDRNYQLQYEIMYNYQRMTECAEAVSQAQSKLNDAKYAQANLQNNLNSANAKFNSAQGSENQKLQKLNEIKEEIKRLEEAILDRESAMQRVADRLDEIPDLKVDGITVPTLKRKVTEIADTASNYSDLIKYLNEAVKSLTKRMSSVSTGNGEAVVDTEEKNLLTLMSSINKNVQSMINIITNPESLRNEMYYIDYVMNKNTYLTSQTSRSHYFDKAEVEYTIFGFDSQGANILSAVGSIYAIRFVIDAVNYFFVDNPCPELLSRIAYAVGRGAFAAAIDMFDMLVAPIDNEDAGASGCALCPSLKNLNIKLSYSDHLRLFLLLNSGTSKEALVNTMSTTLAEKDSKSLDELYTELNATVEVKINLLILPMIGSDLLPDKYFKDGSYIIRERIVEGYE